MKCSERSNQHWKVLLNIQKSAEVIVVIRNKVPIEMKDRINRSLSYDRERRNDHEWQKT